MIKDDIYGIEVWNIVKGCTELCFDFEEWD